MSPCPVRISIADGPGWRSVARAAAWALPAAAALACTSAPSNPSDGGSPSDASEDPVTEAGPGAFLTALSVASSDDASSPIGGVVPAFSSSVHDYYVRCAGRTNALTVSMTAAPGATCALARPTTSPGAREQTLALTVLANQAIVATASDGTRTTEYWVRCLPPEFPSLSMVRHPGAGAASPGYYIVGSARPGRPDYAIVLDGHGVPVWYDQFNPSNVDDVDSPMPDAISFNPTAVTFEIRHINPLATAYAAPSGTVLNTHELRYLPNGNFMVLSDPVRTGVNLTGVTKPLSDGGVESFGTGSNILDCNVVEFEPSGKVVWTWTGFDHIDPARETVAPAITTFPDGGIAVDTYHCNAIDVDPANGNLLVSARNMNAVFYVERSTQVVLWKLGGAHFNKNGATLIANADPFYGQHDARIHSWSMACGGKGQISVFDDHTGMPGTARALLLDVTAGKSSGGVCGVVDPKATAAWQYAGKTPSDSRGSFRIQPDGARVIGWGGGVSPSDPIFTEVDAKGRDLLDFYFPGGEISYRAIKVPASTFDLGALRKAAGS